MTYDNQHPYDGYDPNGTPIDELMKRLMQLQGRIASTVSEVHRVEDELTEKQSQITQTVDEISLEVFEINTDTGGKTSRIGRLEVTADEINSKVSNVETDLTGVKADVSSVTQTASEISSTVTSMDTRLGQAESNITQNAGAITSRVHVNDYNGNTIASMINQDALSVTIAASKINLIGITNVASDLQIGSSGSGGTKKIKFNGQNEISDNGSLFKINGQEVNIQSPYTSFTGGSVSFQGATEIYWGSHAPSTTARFG